MADVKLTKNELRAQQIRLLQLQKYLPTLQLKKAMLQLQVNEARFEIQQLELEFSHARNKVEGYAPLLSQTTAVDFLEAARVKEVEKDYENIAGVDIPIFRGVTFAAATYSLFETPPWVDAALDLLRQMVKAKVKVTVAEEKKAALEKELRDVSIRVNLFEKVLIPRASGNIKKIKIFLGDQQLAAVSQAKVAKGKIIQRKLERMKQ